MSLVVAGKVLMRESYVEINLQEDEGVIVARWKGFLTVEQVKRGCGLMSRVIAEKNISRHLSDHTDLKLLRKEVQEYLSSTWFHEVEALGLRKLAVKTAVDLFAKATVQKVNTEQPYGELRIDTFRSYEAAKKWLQAE